MGEEERYARRARAATSRLSGSGAWIWTTSLSRMRRLAAIGNSGITTPRLIRKIGSNRNDPNSVQDIPTGKR